MSAVGRSSTLMDGLLVASHDGSRSRVTLRRRGAPHETDGMSKLLIAATVTSQGAKRLFMSVVLETLCNTATRGITRAGCAAARSR
ncbi:hypothetical protein BCCH1_10080 [Burkholderia contaminans]|uniref:Uncharacterized protein n=1 Tax=Burkholderia contaminans TaxID=488447 RepID=A0A250L1N8_9BURK|nr:hypothetical protein BCCH1_10080 [Burkholderia contaminans]GLZ67848.1 hypothetical protein Bcon01_08930 [Burkholderia contaminans]